MFRKLEESAGNVLGYEAKDRLTREELESFEREFEAAISRHRKVRLLLHMPEIPRVEPAALWEDLGLTRHLGDIERYVVVSDSTLAEWASKLDDRLVRGTVRHFDLSQYQQAWQWVLEPESTGRADHPGH